jgi:hypothetical protein
MCMIYVRTELHMGQISRGLLITAIEVKAKFEFRAVGRHVVLHCTEHFLNRSCVHLKDLLGTKF